CATRTRRRGRRARSRPPATSTSTSTRRSSARTRRRCGGSWSGRASPTTCRPVSPRSWPGSRARPGCSPTSPGAGQQLRRRAAAWFLRAGEPTEAAVHAAGAGEWRAAVRMLVDGLGIANLLAGPGSERLAWLLADLPADVPGAEAAVVRAAVALARQDTIGCAGELAAAAKLAQRAGTEPAAALTLGSSLVAGGFFKDTADTETTLAAS